MADPPLRSEGGGRLIINKDRESRGGNAAMNQKNEGGKESHPVERSGDEFPVDVVKSLGKIKFEKEALVVPTFKIKRMNDFLSEDNIRGNMSILNKSRLGVVNEPRKMRFKSIR